MSVSNIALQNRISVLARQLALLKQIVCCNSGGLTVVSTLDSDTITWSGTGTIDDPLYAQSTGSVGADTIYTANGSIMGDRTVSLGGNSLTFTGTAGSDFLTNASNNQLVSGTAALGIGTGGFKILNGGNATSQILVTGGGTTLIGDQSSIELRRGTLASGTYSQLSMNPSGTAGAVLQDLSAAGFAQIWVNNSSGSQIQMRAVTGMNEGRIDLKTNSTDFNKVVSGVPTTILKVNTGTSTVALPQILNATSLATDGSGNIIPGSTPTLVGGQFTFNGDGTTDTFTIPHGLPNIPIVALVTRRDDSSGNLFETTEDATNIIVHFVSGPPDNGAVVQVNWFAMI